MINLQGKQRMPLSEAFARPYRGYRPVMIKPTDPTLPAKPVLAKPVLAKPLPPRDPALPGEASRNWTVSGASPRAFSTMIPRTNHQFGPFRPQTNPGPLPMRGDLNRNGRLDFQDVGLVNERYGRTVATDLFNHLGEGSWPMDRSRLPTVAKKAQTVSRSQRGITSAGVNAHMRQRIDRFLGGA